MRFTPTAIPDVLIVDLELREDDRGFFARTFSAQEFESVGLSLPVAQSNLAFTHRAGTLRGLHYQRPPATEAKLLRCTRGRVFDVAVDLRPDSATYLHHVGVILDAEERRAVYVPEGFAHGYLSLVDDVEMVYQVSAPYMPGAEGGLRWDDPALDIAWPVPVRHVSPKDAAWPLLGKSGHS